MSAQRFVLTQHAIDRYLARIGHASTRVEVERAIEDESEGACALREKTLDGRVRQYESIDGGKTWLRVCQVCGETVAMEPDGTHLVGPGPGQTVYTLGRGGPFRLSGRPAHWCGDRAAAAARNEALRVEREARWAKEQAEREAREETAREKLAAETAALAGPFTIRIEHDPATRAVIRTPNGYGAWASEKRWHDQDIDPMPDGFEAEIRAEADAFAERLRRHGATVAWEVEEPEPEPEPAARRGRVPYALVDGRNGEVDSPEELAAIVGCRIETARVAYSLFADIRDAVERDTPRAPQIADDGSER